MTSLHERRNPVQPFTDVILDSVADGVFTVDADWAITSFNKAAEDITGTKREFALGCACHSIFRANICEGGCALRETLRTGQSVVNKAIYIVRPDGRSVPITISTAVLRNAEGDVVGGVETFRDISSAGLPDSELIQENSFRNMVSRSHKMRRIFAFLPDVAHSDSVILIQGSSGTGKELVARAVHDLSPRCDGPFVTINCGALPDTLLESELFGYKAGAFTDAKKDKPGKFALADGGTLFLDEIGDVSPALQSRLLRLVQEKTYEPLGDTHQYTADVRIVAATNKDLGELIRKGEFREDLYFRINVVEITLPDLADRREDIPILASHFLSQLSRLQNKEILAISDEAMSTLMAFTFPGNIRELKNIMEYAVLMSSGGLILTAHLPERVHAASLSEDSAMEDSAADIADKPTLAELEAHLVHEALRRNDYHRLKTANELGISKTTLWRKIKRYGDGGVT